MEERKEIYAKGYAKGYVDGQRALEEHFKSYNSINSLVESNLKNPKAKTFDVLHFVADNAGLSTFEAIEKAYNLGVSEQEPNIDELRVEITALQNRCYALTKGVMCGFCNYECQYKVDRSAENDT